jgi:hypothetical protein
MLCSEGLEIGIPIPRKELQSSLFEMMIHGSGRLLRPCKIENRMTSWKRVFAFSDLVSELVGNPNACVDETFRFEEIPCSWDCHLDAVLAGAHIVRI